MMETSSENYEKLHGFDAAAIAVAESIDMSSGTHYMLSHVWGEEVCETGSGVSTRVTLSGTRFHAINKVASVRGNVWCDVKHFRSWPGGASEALFLMRDWYRTARSVLVILGEEDSSVLRSLMRVCASADYLIGAAVHSDARRSELLDLLKGGNSASKTAEFEVSLLQAHTLMNYHRRVWTAQEFIGVRSVVWHDSNGEEIATSSLLEDKYERMALALDVIPSRLGASDWLERDRIKGSVTVLRQFAVAMDWMVSNGLDPGRKQDPSYRARLVKREAKYAQDYVFGIYRLLGFSKLIPYTDNADDAWRSLLDQAAARSLATAHFISPLEPGSDCRGYCVVNTTVTELRSWPYELPPHEAKEYWRMSVRESSRMAAVVRAKLGPTIISVENYIVSDANSIKSAGRVSEVECKEVGRLSTSGVNSTDYVIAGGRVATLLTLDDIVSAEFTRLSLMHDDIYILAVESRWRNAGLSGSNQSWDTSQDDVLAGVEARMDFSFEGLELGFTPLTLIAVSGWGREVCHCLAVLRVAVNDSMLKSLETSKLLVRIGATPSNGAPQMSEGRGRFIKSYMTFGGLAKDADSVLAEVKDRLKKNEAKESCLIAEARGEIGDRATAMLSNGSWDLHELLFRAMEDGGLRMEDVRDRHYDRTRDLTEWFREDVMTMVYSCVIELRVQVQEAMPGMEASEAHRTAEAMIVCLIDKITSYMHQAKLIRSERGSLMKAKGMALQPGVRGKYLFYGAGSPAASGISTGQEPDGNKSVAEGQEVASDEQGHGSSSGTSQNDVYETTKDGAGTERAGARAEQELQPERPILTGMTGVECGHTARRESAANVDGASVGVTLVSSRDTGAKAGARTRRLRKRGEQRDKQGANEGGTRGPAYWMLGRYAGRPMERIYRSTRDGAEQPPHYVYRYTLFMEYDVHLAWVYDKNVRHVTSGTQTKGRGYGNYD